MPCLRWIGTNGRGQLFPIYKSVTTLGSAGGNDVLLPAPGVASWHAQIVFDGRDFSLDESDPVAESAPHAVLWQAQITDCLWPDCE